MNGPAELFISEHHRCTFVTRRRDGGLQISPVRVMLDASGNIVVCTRRSTAKARNLARDPHFALCVVTDTWSGPWMTIEGTAELFELPDALDALRAFYLQRDGKVAPADEFAATMQAEGRLLLRLHVERTSGTALGAGAAR